MNALELRGVSKSFVVRHNRVRDIKVRLLGWVHRRHREYRTLRRAVDDVDLDVPQGEFLGIIGPNGSGKSTLLRLMAGLLMPSAGEVVVHGRVAPLFELGVGFNGELSGSENLYLNTSLLGLSRRATSKLYGSIVDFAELEEFIDMPMKNYSSGMCMRLGFAVAVHLQADILLLDEVFAVGDEAFRHKCMERMHALRREGRTIVLVTHDLHLVSDLCDRVCLIRRGRLVEVGDPRTVVERYTAAEHPQETIRTA